MYNQTMFIIFFLGAMVLGFVAPFIIIYFEDTPPIK